MLRSNIGGWDCHCCGRRTVNATFCFWYSGIFFSCINQTGRWICFQQWTGKLHIYIIPQYICDTKCLSPVLIHYLVTVALTLSPSLMAYCVSICNYIEPFIPLIMGIMPHVTNLIVNKLSLFKTNSVKMFYILHDRLHCHANAPTDYSLFS